MGSSPARRSLDCFALWLYHHVRSASRSASNVTCRTHRVKPERRLPPHDPAAHALRTTRSTMDRKKPATMAEIATRAGVALSTVSYVLSGKRPVSPEMRERVMAAIEELDYRPHGPARALASGTSHTIALFLPSPQWDLVPVQQMFVAGATQATSASDYALLLSTLPAEPGRDRAPARERPRRRRHRDGDARRRPPHRRPPGERTDDSR